MISLQNNLGRTRLDKKKKGTIFLFLGFLFLQQFLFASDDGLVKQLFSNPDSLNTTALKKLATTSPDHLEMAIEQYFTQYADDHSLTRKTIAHYYKAYLSYSKREYEKALFAFQKAYDIANEAKLTELEYYCLSYMSYANYYLGQRKRYLELLEKMVPLSEKLKNLNYTAMLNHNLMVGYQMEGDFQAAIKFGRKAERLHRNTKNQIKLAETLIGLSDQYKTIGDNKTALELIFEAIEIAEKEENMQTKSEAITTLANVYLSLKEYQKALDYYFINITLKKKLEQNLGLAKLYRNISIAYSQLDQYEKALTYLFKGLKIFEEENASTRIIKTKLSISEIYMALDDLDKAEKYLQETVALVDEETTPKVQYQYYMDFGDLSFQKEKWEMAISNYQKAEKLAEEMEYLRFISNVKQSLAETYLELKKFNKAAIYFREYAMTQDRVFKQDVDESLSLYAVKFDVLQKDKQLDILRRDYEIQNLEMHKEKLKSRILYLVLAFIFITLLLATNQYILKHRALKSEKEASRIVRTEKEKSEKLLLNTLPKTIVEELKEKGVSKPQSFPEVTVLCTDFVDFTKKSTTISPTVLIEELNDLYTKFDEIIEKHNCERIKTIGDAYLAVCGMPLKNPEHATNIVRSALEIIDFLEARNKTAKIIWKIRIGVHSGPVVGGIVGVKKYVYDVFGDSINIAFRMQSHSQPMKINISHMTSYFLEKREDIDTLSIYEREHLEVKGKGTMRMYFVERK